MVGWVHAGIAACRLCSLDYLGDSLLIIAAVILVGIASGWILLKMAAHPQFTDAEHYNDAN